MDTKYALFNNWSDFDFDTLAEASKSVGDHVFAVYLLEFSSKNAEKTKSTRTWQCLLHAYRELNNSPAFQGVISSLDAKSSDFYSLIEQKNCHEKNWLSLWSMEDSIAQVSDYSTTPLLRQSLSESGHFYTLGQTIGDHSDGITKEHYESLWRLGKWNLRDAFDDYSDGSIIDLNRTLYNSLERFENSTSLSSLEETMDLGISHFGLQPTVSNLYLIPLIEIKDAISIKKEPCAVKKIFFKWKQRLEDMLISHPFADVERVLAVRTRLLISLSNSSKANLDLSPSSSPIYEVLSNHLMTLSEIALSEGSFLLARSSALLFKGIFSNLSPLEGIKMDILLYKIEWGRGEETLAMKFFKQRMDELKSSGVDDRKIEAEMNHTYGMWLKKSKRSTPIQIIEDYLKPATQLDDKCGTYFFELARYSDSVLTDMTNDESLKRSEKLLAQREEEFKLLEASSPSKNKEYFMKKIRRQIDIDRDSIQAAKKELQSYLLISVENYVNALSKSDQKTEHSVCRLVALWFSNFTNKQVNYIIHQGIGAVKTSVFLVIMYQLAARLSFQDPDPSSPFYATLSKLVESIVKDYPYHTLGYLIALRNATRDKAKAGNNVSNATQFLKKLCKVEGLKEIVLGMDKLFTSYVNLANLPIPQSKASKEKTFAIDRGCSILSLDERSVLLTCEFPVGAPRDYSDIIFISKMDKSYSLPGGINAPKVIKCLGTDGKVYKQLVKAKGMILILVTQITIFFR